MSLYQVQKFMFSLNRDEALQREYLRDRRAVLASYELTDEEIGALVRPDIGLLYHLGVNGQILMHFAAFHKIAWPDYLQMMRDGIAEHGQVREGVYAITGYAGVEAQARQPGQPSNAPAPEERRS
jgi:hypothetical protein